MLKLHPAAEQPGLIAQEGNHAEDDESGDGANSEIGMGPRLRGDDGFKCNDGTAY
jgi:hypothetical protein